VLNVPVATGASLPTGAQARAEIEIGADAQHRELPPPLGSHPRRQARHQPMACESRISARLKIVT
jgi:hypothetical protein